MLPQCVNLLDEDNGICYSNDETNDNLFVLLFLSMFLSQSKSQSMAPIQPLCYVIAVAFDAVAAAAPVWRRSWFLLLLLVTPRLLLVLFFTLSFRRQIQTHTQNIHPFQSNVLQ